MYQQVLPDVEIFEVFCDNICILSLEVAKVSKSMPSDFFRDTNYTELFVEFLSSNMLFTLASTDPENHTLVSIC